MRFFVLAFCLLAALPAVAADITGLRVEGSGGGEHVSIRLTERVKYRVFRVEAAPPRVVVRSFVIALPALALPFLILYKELALLDTMARPDTADLRDRRLIEAAGAPAIGDSG